MIVAQLYPVPDPLHEVVTTGTVVTGPVGCGVGVMNDVLTMVSVVHDAVLLSAHFVVVIVEVTGIGV